MILSVNESIFSPSFIITYYKTSIDEILEEVFINIKDILSVDLGSRSLEIFEIKRGMSFGDVLFYINQKCPYNVVCKTEKIDIIILNKINFLTCKKKFKEPIINILT